MWDEGRGLRLVKMDEPFTKFTLNIQTSSLFTIFVLNCENV